MQFFQPELSLQGSDLAFRCINQDRSSYDGFIWPESGWVEAKDWKKTAVCGSGLHGLLRGTGDSSHLANENKIFQAVRFWYEDGFVSLGGKVKFRRCWIEAEGTRKEVADYLYGLGYVVHYGTSTSGDRGTSASGDFGTSISGDAGTSTSGNYGTSISGDYGTSSSRDGGTSTSGDWGTSASGEGGIIQIYYYRNCRKRLAIGYIGENGLLPNVPYKFNGKNFVRAT